MTPKPEISFCVDWVSMTIKQSSDFNFLPDFGFGLDIDLWTQTSSKNGYERCYVHPFGHLLMWSPKRPDMGFHLAAGGRALNEMQKHAAIDPHSLIYWASQNDASISRLDLAFDVLGTPVDIDGLALAQQVKGSEGSAEKRSIVTTLPRGKTLYVGSRQSDKFLRIYDKSAEQGWEQDVLWTRVELELKKQTAKMAAGALTHMDFPEMADFSAGLIKGVFNPDTQLWRDIFNQEVIKMPSTKADSHSTLKWLLETVAKTVAKTQAELRHQDVVGDFNRAVEDNLRLMGIDRSKVSKP